MSPARLARAALIAFVGWSFVPVAQAAEEVLPPIEVDWPHEGFFGSFDYAAVQRGFQVYEQVCHACHSMDFIAFRHLGDIGFGEEQVRAIASQYQVTDGPDDQGEMYQREARPSDRIPPPYPNEQAARAANGGALPPDLSLLTKATADGSDYVYSVLRGYEDPPADAEPRPGLFYNLYFPGHWIAMPPPLSPGIVEYDDGTEATVEQMAYDVAAFMTWAAEPKLDERKQAGLKVMLFLIVLTGLFYATKRKIWSDVH